MKTFLTTLMAGAIGAAAAGVIAYTILGASKASALKSQKKLYESQLKKQQQITKQANQHKQ
ncbi:MAG TPA: hypothetical protein EYQ18_06450, partial [Candidatus Handelsmanbacteria bacterium]|nr:hypothetical protein [Candidatus Handelsmanbacteria bacterium]